MKPETLFERLVRPPANEQEDQAATCDLWKMFECHEQILNEHEKRLENNITKIEIIREILEQQKGTFQGWPASMVKKIKSQPLKQFLFPIADLNILVSKNLNCQTVQKTEIFLRL